MGDNKENTEAGAEKSAGEKEFVEAPLPKIIPWLFFASQKIMSDPKTPKLEPTKRGFTVNPKRKYNNKKLNNITWLPLQMDVKTETVDVKEESVDCSEIQNIEKSTNNHIETKEDADFEELSNIFNESVNLNASKDFSYIQKKIVVKDKPILFMEEEEDDFIIINHDDVFIKQEFTTDIDEINIDTKVNEEGSNNVHGNESSYDSETSTSNESSDSDYGSYDNDSDSNKGKRKKKKKKIYICVKCRFTGVYRDCLFHMQECPLEGRKNKSADKDSVSDEAWREYPCSKCKTTFSTMRRYLQHLALTHYLDHAECPKCGENLKNLTALDSHVKHHIKQLTVLRKHTRISRRLIVSWVLYCKECTTPVKDEFFSHWEKKHIKFTVSGIETKVAEETVRARVRNKYKAGSKEMVNLILGEISSAIHFTKMMRIRICVVCKRQFKSNNDCKRHLIEHLLASHEAVSPRPRVRTFTCQFRYCKHKEDTLHRYREHLRAHARLPHYKCEICDRTFSHSNDFIKHMKMHKTGCRICNKMFESGTSLRRHMQQKHFTTKPVTCCGGQFPQSQLKRHIRSEHDVVSV